jgi:pyrroloquinoline quinone (PQQ) biosynthesis protein C/quercetin dioxygenase-like cupin family protein
MSALSDTLEPISLIFREDGKRVEDLLAIDFLTELHNLRNKHPFWNNPLFRACSAGALTIEDFHFIFSQYYLYSKNFTRYLAAIMANCEDDLFRAHLSENMWEEGGGAAPEKRHAEIFRQFLRDGLSIDIENIEYMDFTRHFTQEYLNYCLRSNSAAASAFFSLGTEGIVARMYGIFTEGLIKAGIDDLHLEFFRIHMECDDEHAATLEEMMLSYSNTSDWYNTCLDAMNHALDLRLCFFNNLYDAIQIRRIKGVLEKIQSRQSLTPDLPDVSSLHHQQDQKAIPLYSNTNERLNIEFLVERVPFTSEVLDPRVVRIPAGKFNEKHRHAHETIFYIISGKGRVLVNDAVIEVKAGDMVFVPRWAMHQSQNIGNTEMTILAVTDFNLTGRAYIGNYLKTARMK